MSATANGDADRRQVLASSGSLRLEILGPLRVWRDAIEVNAGPPQQALLLAVLLGRVGSATTTDELTWQLWGDSPPPSALNTIQRYVGALRHLLEPGLPQRAAGSFIHRRGDAYLYVGGDGALDLVDFRQLVSAARAYTAEGSNQRAFDDYERALALWHGPAGAGLSKVEHAAPVFVSLNAEYLDTCTVAADVALSLGRPERAIPFLQRAVAMEPFHEPLHARLVSALAAAGQQRQALGLFDAVRTRLADELGIEPSEVLLAAQRAVYERPLRTLTAQGTSGASIAGSQVAHVVGRAEQFKDLWAVTSAALGGGSGVATVEGQPGIGKTHLLDALSLRAHRHGMLVARGICTEGDGSPALWPWREMLTSLLRLFPSADREPWLTGDLGGLLEPAEGMLATPVLPDSGVRFRLFERVVDVLRAAAAQRPTLLILDDLQWADPASLQLFGHVASRVAPGMVLIGALRDRAPALGPEMTRMLADLSRASVPRRVRLPALSETEVAELVRSELGWAMPSTVAANLHERTAGNPYFALALARLHAAAGDSDVGAVPSTVLSVVKDRTARLADTTRFLLEVAAVIGTEFDVRVLAAASACDEQTCLDRLQELEEHGLASPSMDTPRSFRFAHDIVRESVIETTGRATLLRLHLAVADALDQSVGDGDSGIERVAYHLWSAGPLAAPARTADALLRAGQAAAAKCAFESAEGHLRSAASIALATGQPEVELAALAQLIAAVGMTSGYVGSALGQLERAELLARDLGKEREAADLLFSRYCAHSQAIQLGEAGRLASRLLDHGEASADPVVRSYGWMAWGIHQWDIGRLGDSYEYLARVDVDGFDDESVGDGWQLRRDLRMLLPVFAALATALHGDVTAARVALDALDAAAGDDAYAITVWSTFSVVIAALAGDPVWAARVADRGITVDPNWSFGFLGSYQRLGRRWARAMDGDHSADMATEAAAIISANLENPPLSGLSTWYCLLAEMWLAAGDLERAEESLVTAERQLVLHGQLYAEGLLMLLRAQLMRDRGDSIELVVAAAQQARDLSADRGVHLFERRAEEFLATTDPRRSR